MYRPRQINVEVSNLKHRADRLEHVIQEFKKFPIFNVSFNEPVEMQHADDSILQSIASYVGKNYNEPFFIYAEDDVVFTDNFDVDTFVKSVEWMEGKADILLGGVSYLRGMLTSLYDLPSNVVRIDGYRGSHFTVIYKTAYDTILKVAQEPNSGFEKAFDKKLCVYAFHPFIAEQKDFGYSDTGHAYTRTLDAMFKRSNEKLNFLKKTMFVY